MSYFRKFIILLFLLILDSQSNAVGNSNLLLETISEEIIIDSNVSFDEAIKGTRAPQNLIDSLCLLDVKYYSVDNKIHKGQLVINKSVKKDLEDIFKIILEEKFIINKILPISFYYWDDSSSMEDNNTSAFNYRNIAGTNRLSNHSFGRAVDINPFFNPVVYNDGTISPKKANYIPDSRGTFSENNLIVKEFKKRGWRWGGNFNSYKDYHHFDK